LDDYVFTEWHRTQPDLAKRLASRVIGDFRDVAGDPGKFEVALGRVIDALKKTSPGSPR
jgi:hypothetical protein